MVNQSEVSKTLEDLNPVEEYPYATYIEGRTHGSGWAGGDDYKRHLTLAQAKSAVTLAQRSSSIVVRDEDGKVTGQRAPETRIYRWSQPTPSEGKWLEVFI